jgi:hypothetical protein
LAADELAAGTVTDVLRAGWVKWWGSDGESGEGEEGGNREGLHFSFKERVGWGSKDYEG